MTSRPSLAAELGITIANPEVWLAIGLALLLGAACWLFGTWLARAVGLLRPGAPAGETLGVGLASGLLVIAAWWAAIWSGGRSSFTPVAVGFAIALFLAGARRVRRRVTTIRSANDLGTGSEPRVKASVWRVRRAIVLTGVAASLFVIAVALLFGSTMAPSPRDGLQPVEFLDQAFYSVLGRDLAATGTESNLSPSGFADLPGLPAQTWYHWGELWLAAAVISIFDAAPMAARYLIVLPIVLLAAAALTGTLVQRMARTTSRWAYAFGFLVCLFLAPVPLVQGPFFSTWAVGMVFGIGLYGLAAVAVLLVLYCLATFEGRNLAWPLAAFSGSAVAFILPAHVVVSMLGVVGVGSAWLLRICSSLRKGRGLPTVSPSWRRAFIATAAMIVASIAWGQSTGHDLGGSAVSTGISPFNLWWSASVTIAYLGGGLFFAIPVAWAIVRRRAPLLADVLVGTLVLLVVGGIAWGARLADFNMYHVFFAGIAVFATPVAAVAVYVLFERLREAKLTPLTAGLVVLCAGQLALGAMSSLVRLQEFGPRPWEAAIPVSLLREIERLPPDAKLAYVCPTFDEVAFTVPRLLSIDAHTSRRVVPMCFEADYFSTLIGGRSLRSPNPSFAFAPQAQLYPDPEAMPSEGEITAFLRANGIGYIYADLVHPNSLVADAVPIASSGSSQVLRIP